MSSIAIAAWTYAAATLVAAVFQAALAAGAPWGEYAMGGLRKGVLPAGMRVAAAVQALLLCALAGIVLERAGVALPDFPRLPEPTKWIPVGVSAIALCLNLITRSAGERRLWAPVAAVLLASSLWVAFAT